MKNILFFFLGIAAVLLMAGTQGRQLFLLEPVTPKMVMILTYNGGCVSNCKEPLNIQAKPYLRQGYIIKLVTSDRYEMLMVLEKY